jgi:hypothetical protein
MFSLSQRSSSRVVRSSKVLMKLKVMHLTCFHWVSIVLPRKAIFTKSERPPPRIIVTTSYHTRSRLVPTTVLGENPIKPPTMTQPSRVHAGHHERSLRETDTPDDAGNETGQMCKNKMTIDADMTENGSEGVREETLGKKPIKETKMMQQSILSSNRHERSLSQTDTLKDEGNETKQARKNRSSIDAVMSEKGSEGIGKEPSSKHIDRATIIQ